MLGNRPCFIANKQNPAPKPSIHFTNCALGLELFSSEVFIKRRWQRRNCWFPGICSFSDDDDDDDDDDEQGHDMPWKSNCTDPQTLRVVRGGKPADVHNSREILKLRSTGADLWTFQALQREIMPVWFEHTISMMNGTHTIFSCQKVDRNLQHLQPSKKNSAGQDSFFPWIRC